MKALTKTLALTTTAALLSAGAANAAVIAAKNFDTATKTGTDTMTGIVWTGDDLVNVAPSASASFVVTDGDTGAAPVGFSKAASVRQHLRQS